MAGKIKPTTIEEYIAGFPAEVQERLFELHQYIRVAAPGAKEELKWGMPAYSYSKILVMFGGFKKHAGFFPGVSAMKAFKKDLAKFRSSNATVQFPYDQPLPGTLIKKMVKHRVKEEKAGVIRWTMR